MPSLTWITDEDLEAAVEQLRQEAGDAAQQAPARQRKNVVDPFLSLLIAETLGVTMQLDLEQRQSLQSATQGISMALGRFHQRVLGSVAGWFNHDAGYDLECSERRLLAEVKNKHNTMNASNRQQVISDLDTAVRQKGRGWEGYLVYVIAKRKRRYKKRLNTARPVYEIDGGSFYALVTGQADALGELFRALNGLMAPSPQIADYCHDVFMRGIPSAQPPLDIG